MKKFFFILGIALISGINGFAQEEERDGSERIRDKMNEFIQKRLHLSNAEAHKFTPVFLRYFKEWRNTIRENKGDRLLLQHKIVDLRLRYRTEFREILGEKRANMVYDQQEIFIKEMRELGRQRMKDRPMRSNKGLLME